MDYNNNNHVDPDAAKIIKTVFTWIGIIICLNAFWPLGLYLIYRQLTKPSVKNSKLFTTLRQGCAKALEQERTDPGTVDISTEVIGFASFEQINPDSIDFASLEELNVNDMNELISQSLLISIYTH